MKRNNPQSRRIRGSVLSSRSDRRRADFSRSDRHFSSTGHSRAADSTLPPHDARDDEFEGVLAIARSGVGFVSPASGGDDILVPQRCLGAALSGDIVRCRLLPPSTDGRSAAEVLRVVERSHRDIVGTLRNHGRHLYVAPMGQPGGTAFRVDDPKGAKLGDRVVLRFAAWNAGDDAPAGEIVDVIGPADNPSLDTEAVIRHYGLPREFPPEVLAEAETVSARLAQPGEGRRDLRGEYIVTIDPKSAKDFDDAISLTRDDAGRRVLGVHIADVTHFVRPGSALDREARKRGTSVYLVDKVIPMLPEQLSNGVCSLRPDEDRLAFSVFLTIDDGGAVIGRDFTKSIIRSRLRLTYEEAMAELAHAPSPTGRELPAEAKALIREACTLAQQVRARRFRNNALDLAIPEVRIDLAPDGRMTGISTTPQDESHQLIEEFMVLANEAVAAECAARRIPYLSRFHDAPDPEKLEELAVSLAGLGIQAGNIQIPRNLANLVRSLKDNPFRATAEMMILRSMKRAEYSADEHGHFGLGKTYYSHFTSPIRRYPDLVLHRQLGALLATPRGTQPSLAELQAIARTSTETEFRAEQAERELVEIKKYGYLRQAILDGSAPVLEATVTRVTEFGVFIEVGDLGLSGMVHVSELSDSFLRFHKGAGTLAGGGVIYSVGQRLRVIPAAVDAEERKIDFVLAEKPGARSTAKGKPRRK